MKVKYGRTQRYNTNPKTTPWGTTTDRIIEIRSQNGHWIGTLEHVNGTLWEWEVVMTDNPNATEFNLIDGPFDFLHQAKDYIEECVKLLSDVSLVQEHVDEKPKKQVIISTFQSPERKEKKGSCTCRPAVEKALNATEQNIEDFKVSRRNPTNVEVWENDKFKGLYACYCKCGKEGIVNYLNEV